MIVLHKTAAGKGSFPHRIDHGVAEILGEEHLAGGSLVAERPHLQRTPNHQPTDPGPGVAGLEGVVRVHSEDGVAEPLDDGRANERVADNELLCSSRQGGDHRDVRPEPPVKRRRERVPAPAKSSALDSNQTSYLFPGTRQQQSSRQERSEHTPISSRFKTFSGVGTC